ncbi:MAG: hypothetical protein AAGA25_15750 [Planctomycetota bacterium]
MAGAASITYLVIALRGGSLLAALASGLPSWRLMDPVAILPEPTRKHWWRRRPNNPIDNSEPEKLFD